MYSPLVVFSGLFYYPAILWFGTPNGAVGLPGCGRLAGAGKRAWAGNETPGARTAWSLYQYCGATMIELPIYSQQGQQIDQMQIDEALLGGKVRAALLKQAIVMYHANKRQGTATTKSRGMVTGSTRKLFRQKGTGRARMGANRTVVRTGGGVAFAKRPRDFSQRMPRKQRRLARDSAILAKIKSNNTVIIDKLEFDEPKTKDFAQLLVNLKIDRSCLVATENHDINVYKSLRNLQRIDAMEVDQLNAGDICNKRTLLLTRKALEGLLGGPDDANSDPENRSKAGETV